MQRARTTLTLCEFFWSVPPCLRAMASKAQSVYSHDLRDTATPLCGNLHPQPETSKNTLLSKPQLGSVKSKVWKLPSDDHFQHEYGLPNMPDGVTSAIVLGSWQQHSGTADQLPGRDFKQLNAEAATVGLTTAKGFAEYRQTHDARIKPASGKVVLPTPYDATTTFGRSTKASTNFNDLISHSFRYEWSSTQPSAAEVSQSKKGKKPGQTKTSMLQAQSSRTKVIEFEAKEALEEAHLNKKNGPIADNLWKMTNFERVPAKIGHTG